MPRVYATEPVMHDGEVFMPGDAIDGDENMVASIILSGRGTLSADTAVTAKKQAVAAQKAADAAGNS